MSTLTIYFKGGTHKTYDSNRSGGSYTPSIRYEGTMAIVTDVWGTQEHFPVADIERVEIPSSGRW